MADSVPFWWHSIDLGGGLFTKGVKCGGDMSNELKSLRLPDLRGKTVLDIGPMDGFYLGQTVLWPWIIIRGPWIWPNTSNI